MEMMPPRFGAWARARPGASLGPRVAGEAHGVVALLVVLENAGQRDDAAVRDVDGHTPLIAAALLEEAVGPQLLLDRALRGGRIEAGDRGRRRTRLRDYL